MGSERCQACREREVEVLVDDEDSTDPYSVCGACARRLRAKALRPLEWFNLASIHGSGRYLLHDDFYDDQGEAAQPDEPVVAAERFPIPRADASPPDLDRILDRAVATSQVDAEAENVLSRFAPRRLLDAVRKRVAASKRADIHNVAYEVCGKVLGPAAGEWVRERWGAAAPDVLFQLAHASAACLPLDEGFERTVGFLEALPTRARPDEIIALSWFRSERTLDWIEGQLQDPAQPIPEAWGRVAAVSRLSWHRVRRWIVAGRPLSLVALDALTACW